MAEEKQIKNRLKIWLKKNYPEKVNDENNDSGDSYSSDSDANLSRSNSPQPGPSVKTKKGLSNLSANVTTSSTSSSDDSDNDANLPTSNSPQPGTSNHQNKRLSNTNSSSSLNEQNSSQESQESNSDRQNSTSPQPGPSNANQHSAQSTSSPTLPNSIASNHVQIFENDFMTLFVYKATHQRQRQFRFQDTLFHIKAALKKNSKPPLLKDLLDILNEALNYLLKNLKTFFNLHDHNVAYFCLVQDPMVNGLNTGPFNLNEDSTKLVDKLLSMLNTYLISNQNLELNNSFKIYVNVLSIDQEKYNKNKKPKKQYKRFGSRTKKSGQFNQYWALDIPQSFSFKLDIFKNQCLLLALILADLQNSYFENSSDKRFIHAQGIISNIVSKQKKAIKVLTIEVEKATSVLNLNLNEPIDLERDAAQLSSYFSCQIIILSESEIGSKLKYMYPKKYDDTLKPAYLFQPFNDSNHLVFIRHIKSFFRSNGSICLACKKSYKSPNYRHFCLKFDSCFACRRFFQQEKTYINQNNKNNFCNGKVCFSPSFLCKICNTSLLSQECALSHKQLCGKKGLLGYKCLKCKKFNYRSGNLRTCQELKKNHICGEKLCIYCKQYYPLDDLTFHVCKLQLSNVKEIKPTLAFVNIEFFANSSSNCEKCYKLKLKYKLDNNLSWKDLFNQDLNSTLVCEFHLKKENLDFEPKFISILKETNNNQFSLSEIVENFPPYITTCKSTINLVHDERILKPKKSTAKKFANFEHLLKKSTQTQTSLGDLFCNLMLSSEWHKTTVIIQDQLGTILVSSLIR